jgi:hypothetical protein
MEDARPNATSRFSTRLERQRQTASSRNISLGITEAGEVASYDVQARREMWSSRFINAKFLPVKAGLWNTFSDPAFSPDGTQIVCIAREERAMDSRQNFPMDKSGLNLPCSIR